MPATALTLYVTRLDECTGNDESFGEALPGYIERVRASLPAGVELVINEHDLSTASLTDDDDQQLAQEINHRVEFWD